MADCRGVVFATRNGVFLEAPCTQEHGEHDPDKDKSVEPGHYAKRYVEHDIVCCGTGRRDVSPLIVASVGEVPHNPIMSGMRDCPNLVRSQNA